MPQEEKPIFTVDASGGITILRINGRASYLTSAPVNSLFGHLLERGKCKFIVDFRNCVGMDSTFLGILAGAAMKIRKKGPDGFLELCNLNERNLELVRNLGLHRILTIIQDEKDSKIEGLSTGKSFESVDSRAVAPESVLEAHRNLIDANKSNAAKFEDVIKYLEKETR